MWFTLFQYMLHRRYSSRKTYSDLQYFNNVMKGGGMVTGNMVACDNHSNYFISVDGQSLSGRLTCAKRIRLFIKIPCASVISIISIRHAVILKLGFHSGCFQPQGLRWCLPAEWKLRPHKAGWVARFTAGKLEIFNFPAGFMVFKVHWLCGNPCI